MLHRKVEGSYCPQCRSDKINANTIALRRLTQRPWLQIGVIVTYTAKNDGSKLTFTADIDPKKEADAKADFEVRLGNLSGTGATGVGTINDATQVITAGKPAQTVTQATADFKLSTDMLADGNTIKIGDQEFTINYSSDKPQDTAIGVKDLLDDTGKLDSTKVAETP